MEWQEQILWVLQPLIGLIVLALGALSGPNAQSREEGTQWFTFRSSLVA
jgi:hypothetical protein